MKRQGLAAKKEERFTYSDYLKWPADERWELIEGVAYNMSPAPSRRHQEVVLELASLLHNYLRDKPCQVYIAPFDVRLPEGDEADSEIETVVQPDIAVFCEEEKLDERGAKGAPDIVIEVISAQTAKKDLLTKRYLYEKHKVKQYIIFDPETEEVALFKLKEEKYEEPEEYTKNDKIKIFDLKIELSTIFR
jgi:Uma2 family endonuclease